MKHYSIVIPTFGRNKFLKDCLISVEQQLKKPQEVFIIDNNILLADQKSVSKGIQNKIKFSRLKKVNFDC